MNSSFFFPCTLLLIIIDFFTERINYICTTVCIWMYKWYAKRLVSRCHMKDYQDQIWQTMIFCFNEISFSGYPHCFCQLVDSDQKGTPLQTWGGGKPHTNNKDLGEKWLRRELMGTSYMLLPLFSSGKYLQYSVLQGKVSTQDAKLRDWLLLVPRCNRTLAAKRADAISPW